MKRSKKYGILYKRYFVLQESPVHFCVLKEYENAIQTAWGLIPIKMLSYIPITAVEKVQARSVIDPHASKKDFVVVASNASRFRTLIVFIKLTQLMRKMVMIVTLCRHTALSKVAYLVDLI